MTDALAEAADLLGEALRDVAEFDWLLYALGEPPEPSAAARAHEHLLTVRRLLTESGYGPQISSGDDQQTTTNGRSTASIRELGQAAYQSPWRSVLSIDNSLPKMNDITMISDAPEK